MKFLIDENIRKEVKDFLIASGHDAISIPKGSSDERLAKIAKSEKRIILTHDVDFSNTWSYPPKEYSGIIRIKIHPPTAEIINHALSAFLKRLSVDEIDKRSFVLEKNNFPILI